jgi:hypothetical protein
MKNGKDEKKILIFMVDAEVIPLLAGIIVHIADSKDFKTQF